MNKVILCGRLTKDVEARYSTQGADNLCIARYTLAVDRKDREQNADFINCVAFGKSGEFAEKYLHKGMKILVVGRIQTGSYKNNEGKMVYTTDVVVEEHEFVESKKESVSENKENETFGFMNVPVEVEEELPFARPTR